MQPESEFYFKKVSQNCAYLYPSPRKRRYKYNGSELTIIIASSVVCQVASIYSADRKINTKKSPSFSESSKKNLIEFHF